MKNSLASYTNIVNLTGFPAPINFLEITYNEFNFLFLFDSNQNNIHTYYFNVSNSNITNLLYIRNSLPPASFLYRKGSTAWMLSVDQANSKSILKILQVPSYSEINSIDLPISFTKIVVTKPFATFLVVWS